MNTHVKKYAPTSMLDYVPDSALFEALANPKETLENLASFYGVSATALHGRIMRNPEEYMRAQAIKARRLHDYAVAILYQEPERMIDAGGNDRIDPSSVALMRVRSSEASRIAGILDRRLSDKAAELTVKTDAPLAAFLAKVAATGSSIPIAPHIVDLDDEGDPIL